MRSSPDVDIEITVINNNQYLSTKLGQCSKPHINNENKKYRTILYVTNYMIK